jgi:hypothetical protein
LSKIRSKKEKVETSWEEFQDIQYAIECQTEEPAAEEKYRAEFEDLYFEVMAECDKRLTEADNKENQNSEKFNKQLSSIGGKIGNTQRARVQWLFQRVGNVQGRIRYLDPLKRSSDQGPEVDLLKAALSGDAAEVVK